MSGRVRDRLRTLLRPVRLAQIRRGALQQLPTDGSAAPFRSAVASLGRSPRDPVAAGWAVRLEERRSRLLRSSEVVPLAEGTSTVAEICRRTSKEPAFCSFLYELVATLQPRAVVEMGTSVGVSGSYLAAALREGSKGSLVTLDALPGVMAVALRDLADLGLTRVRGVVGRFDETLEGVLRAEAPLDFLFIDGHHQEQPTLDYFEAALPHLAQGAVIVFDDIQWSDGMRRAWAKLRVHPAVAFALDLRVVGVVRLRSPDPSVG